MRVTLIRPPEVNPYWTAPKPSLGVSYLCSYLQLNNIECRIFDANFNSWKEDELIREVIKYNPDLIGISSMTHEILISDRIAAGFKNRLKNIPVVIGGCHATALPEETLQEFRNFTFVVYGEGEKTMLELAKNLRDGSLDNPQDIYGIAYRDEQGRLYKNPARQRLSSQELDELPYPAFNQYYGANVGALAKKNDHYVMMTSRGCPYNCAFCMQVLGRQVRRRSAKSIVAEMEYAIEKYGAHTIFFVDEIFLFNDGLMYDTFELIKLRALQKRIRWKAATRANLVNEKLIKEAKEAGCFFVEIGVESGSNEILKNINKQITVEQVERAVGIIKKEKLLLSVDLILGHPNETNETIKETVSLAVRLNPNFTSVGIMTPYPGTRIYEMAQRGQNGYRLLTRDWSRYDKYGGRSLELEAISHRQLENWQRRLLLYVYLKNFRFLDLIKFIIRYRKTIFRLVLQNK